MSSLVLGNLFSKSMECGIVNNKERGPLLDVTMLVELHAPSIYLQPLEKAAHACCFGCNNDSHVVRYDWVVDPCTLGQAPQGLASFECFASMMSLIG